MPSPTELAESLREMHAELVKLGAFDSHASVIQNVTLKLYQLAIEVGRLDTEIQVLMRMVGERKHK